MLSFVKVCFNYNQVLKLLLNMLLPYNKLFQFLLFLLGRT